MEACGFDESNCVLDKPQDMTHEQCTSLEVWRGPNQEGITQVISCWKLTKEEVDELLKTGRIWVIIAGKTMPPLFLSTLRPWV